MNQRQLCDGDVQAHGVDQKIVAGDLQAFERPRHGKPGGFENIHAVDFERIRGAHGPGNRAFADSLSENLTPLGFELLTIVETAEGTVRIEHDGRGEHGPEQRAPPSFIQAGDDPVPGLTGGALVAARRHRCERIKCVP